MRLSIVLLAIAFALACGSDPVGPTVTTVGDTTFVKLPYGTSATAGDVSVAFDRLLEDSRCPLGVTCVQAGTAVIQLTLADASGSEVVDLELGLGIDFGNHRVDLRDLTPYPGYGQLRDVRDYVAHLAVYEAP
jgi:hypothetical protein